MKITRKRLIRLLENRIGLCTESIAWLSGIEGPPEHLWKVCPYGDWLVDAAVGFGVDARFTTLAAADCVESALRWVERYDGRLKIAVEVARDWSRDLSSAAELRAACDAAFSVYTCLPSDAKRSVETGCLAASKLSRPSELEAAVNASMLVFGHRASESAGQDGAWDRAEAIDKAALEFADIIRARVPWSAVEAAIEAALKEVVE